MYKVTYIRCKFKAENTEVMSVTGHQTELLIGNNLNCWYQFVFHRSEY